MRLPLLLFLPALLVLAAVSHVPAEKSDLDGELARCEALKIEAALQELSGVRTAQPMERAAFLVGIRNLTDGETVAAYRLYFFVQSQLTPDLAPFLVRLARSQDPSVRLWSLKLLRKIKPTGLAKTASDMFLADPSEDVAWEASPLVGFYGPHPDARDFLRLAFAQSDHEKRAEALYRCAGTSDIPEQTLRKAAQENKGAYAVTIAALALSLDNSAFELARSPEYASAITEAWLWPVLADLAPATACSLFAETIALTHPEDRLGDIIDGLFGTAGIKAPDAAMSAAETLQAKGKTDSYLRALARIAAPEALAKMRKVVESSQSKIERLQRGRYLLEAGDYSVADSLAAALKDESIANYPRRKTWAAMIMSYYSHPSALPVMEDAWKNATTLSAKCAALGPLARLAPSKAEALLAEVVPKWIAADSEAWRNSLPKNYNDTPLPELYNSLYSLVSAISELPAGNGLVYANSLLSATEQAHHTDIVPAFLRWGSSSEARNTLANMLRSHQIAVSAPAANILGSTGSAGEYARLLEVARSTASLAVREAALYSAANLALVDPPKARGGAEVRLNAMEAALPASISEPWDSARELIPNYPADEPARVAAVAKVIKENAGNSARVSALLALLSRDTGTDCSRLLEYSPFFTRHDPASTIIAYLKARRAIKN